MATTLASQASEYFSSLSPLAKKVNQDKENLRRRYGEEEWTKLTHEQQEDLLNKFFVDVEILEQYASEADEEERPDCFPKLMIPCGEKICVDFDNDQGWTWRDEHSGPFSWMTRSQQDLTLFDDEDEGIEDDASDTNKNGGTSNKSTPVGTPKRPLRSKAKKAQSPRPEHKGNLAYKPEKSIWDSPFLAADRGLDSAYPSSHSSDQSKGSDESDHGDMINKFGMAAAFSNAVREAEEAERNSGSVCSSDDIKPDTSNIRATLPPPPPPPGPPRKDSSPDRSSATLDVGPGYRASPSRDSISSSGSGKSSGNRKKSSSKSSSKDKHWKPSRTDKKPEAEQALMSELSVSVGSSIGAEEMKGQVSPVYIEDPGESSSDFNASINSNAKFLFQDTLKQETRADTSSSSSSTVNSGPYMTSASGQINLAMDETSHTSNQYCEELDDWKVDLFSMSKVTQPLLAEPGTDTSQDSLLHNNVDDSDAPKTGFDFLDNW